MDFANHTRLDEIIEAALIEDIGTGDHTTRAIFDHQRTASAQCLYKEPGIAAGIEVARRIYQKIDAEIRFEASFQDGQEIQAGDIPFQVHGNIYTLLTAERLVLNIMQRMSGIATLTHAVVQTLAGTGCRVLDTRKTTPLIRHLEKWAVQIGGGVNHRLGLYDMMLLKDNHIDYMGGVKPALEAIERYQEQLDHRLPVVIETRNQQEVEAVLAYQQTGGQVDRILLDNMSPDQLRTMVKLIDQSIPTEASGGITPEQAHLYGAAGVDFISMGALTHSVKSIDISLKLK